LGFGSLECGEKVDQILKSVNAQVFLGCMTKKWGFKLLLPRSLRNGLISDNSARR
jgi:hypothetical protein